MSFFDGQSGDWWQESDSSSSSGTPTNREPWNYKGIAGRSVYVALAFLLIRGTGWVGVQMFVATSAWAYIVLQIEKKYGKPNQ